MKDMTGGGGGGGGGGQGTPPPSSSPPPMDPVNASGLLGSTRWTEEGLYLKEFVHKHSLPKVIRVVKGQYLGVLGVPSIANSISAQHCLLVSAGRRRRLLAQGVKFKEGKIVAAGAKVAIPPHYDGYFELLSEDGRSVRCIESVQELCRRFPDSVLVRDDVTAFVSKSDDIDAIRDRSRLIRRGETLILVGEVLAVKSKAQERFLRCLDSRGENVYLPHELRGCRFSAVAKEGNISGVHTAGNLLNKRVPFMARLVHGKTPEGLANFVPELRMLTVLDEECLFGLVLNKESVQVLPLPPSALLKVQTAANADEVAARPEFARLVDRCQELAGRLADGMTVHDVSYARDLRLNGGGGGNNNSSSDVSYQQRRKARRASQMILHHPSSSSSSPFAKENGGADGGKANKDEYDEIEQIYDYVRGFAPLPRSARGWRYDAVLAPREDEVNGGGGHHSGGGGGGSGNNSSGGEGPGRQDQQQQQQPPEPPPIETMPSGRPPTLLLPPPPPTLAQSASMEFAYCATPPPGTPGSPMAVGPQAGAHVDHWEYLKTATVDRNMRGRSGASKKRQRNPAVVAADNTENLYVGGGGPSNATAVSNRFVKTPSGGAHNSRQAHRFFKLHHHLSRAPPRETQAQPLYHMQQQSSLTLSRSNLYSKPSPASFFQLRYKSLNNLAAACSGGTGGGVANLNPSAEYDTMESSNSGGKTSAGDSGGSRTLPEKRSRKLSRPKSLTNLVLGTAYKGYNVTQSPVAAHQSGPGGGGGHFSSGNKQKSKHHVSSHHSNKLGTVSSSSSSANKRRLGTLYL